MSMRVLWWRGEFKLLMGSRGHLSLWLHDKRYAVDEQMLREWARAAEDVHRAAPSQDGER